jgi:RNA polymerase sporulation-specific sigma factor
MNSRDKIISDNLGLVHSCCNKFKGRGIEYDELFSAGCMGLVKAVNKFNPDLGLQLSTYAVPVILGEIKGLFRSGGTVKVSRSLKELSIKINKVSSDFQKKYDKSPTINELASLLETSKEKIIDAINSSKIPLSLTNNNEDDDEKRQIDLPTDDIMESVTEKLALEQVMNKLNDKDKNIIELRYYKQKTQCETAKILNMTQVQVSRREKKILLFLRSQLNAQ